MGFNSYFVNVGTSDTTIVTATNTTMVLELRATNTYGATVPVDIKVVRGGTTVYLRKQVRVEVGNDFVMQGSKLLLMNGDVLKAVAPLAGAVDVLVSVYSGLT